MMAVFGFLGRIVMAILPRIAVWDLLSNLNDPDEDPGGGGYTIHDQRWS